MTSPDAFLRWSPFPPAGTAWGEGAPLDGIGVRLGAGSWARWNGWEGTRTIRVHPSPASWNMPGLWGTVEQWAGRAAPSARPLMVPWGNGWGGPGGFTAEQDNGIMVDLDRDRTEGYELLGLRPATLLDRFLIGWATGAMPADGCYVADRINQRRPGVTPKGAQGPWWWQQGVLGPEMLRGAPWNGPLRIVVHNVSFGPTAVSADPAGWVEHTEPGQPYGPTHPVVYPEGPDHRMVDCGQEYTVTIDDARIGRWLDDMKVPRGELRTSKGMFAEGLARHGMKLMLTGTGNPHGIAVGWRNRVNRAAWAAVGVTTDLEARQLGAGLFRYCTIGAPL